VHNSVDSGADRRVASTCACTLVDEFELHAPSAHGSVSAAEDRWRFHEEPRRIIVAAAEWLAPRAATSAPCSGWRALWMDAIKGMQGGRVQRCDDGSGIDVQVSTAFLGNLVVLGARQRRQPRFHAKRRGFASSLPDAPSRLSLAACPSRMCGAVECIV
jgi:hypothetical protein